MRRHGVARSGLVATAALLALLAGCALPGPEQPGATLFSAERTGLPAQADALPLAGDWWQSFDDSALSRLIGQALAAHPTLAQAQARAAQARAMADMVHSATSPQVSLQASVTRQRFTENSIYPPPYGGGVYNSGALDAALSWSPDFFGRLDAQWTAQMDQAHAAEADASAARLTLAGQVSRVYLQLGRLVAQKGVAERTLAQREEMLGLTRQRVAAGLDTALELTQSEGALPDARNQIEAIDEQIMLARHALAALTAQPVGALDSLSPALPVRGLTAGGHRLGADLLSRRPDIAAARWRVDAAGANIRSARAEFYPDIELNGLIGLSSLGLNNLFESGSREWSVGPALHLPLFEGGRLTAQLSGREAERDAVVAQYNATVLTAVREAADALGSLQSLERQQAEQSAALASAAAAAELVDNALHATDPVMAHPARANKALQLALSGRPRKALHVLERADPTLLDDISAVCRCRAAAAALGDRGQVDAAITASRDAARIAARNPRAAAHAMGVAEHADSESADSWFRRADGMLYAAKRNGRNAVHADASAAIDAAMAAVPDARAEVIEAGFGREEIARRLGDRLAEGSLPTAIFTLNSALTLGTLKALGPLGLEIPLDVSLLGFDDYEWMEVFRPPLSAIRQPVAELAQAAWQRLAALTGMAPLAGAPALCHLRLPCSLAWRGSVAPPQASAPAAQQTKRPAAAITGRMGS